MVRALFVVCCVAALLWSAPIASTQKAAASLFIACLGEARTECYEEWIYQLYPAYSAPELFGAIAMMQRVDRQAVPCHFIAHRVAAAVIAHDPSAWTREIASPEAGRMCSFGYVHGIAIAAFKDHQATSGIADEEMLVDVCDALPGGQSRSNCFHGLGHIAYYMAPAIDDALSICDRATDDARDLRRCHAGVFMKLFFLTPDDPIPDPDMPAKEDIARFCGALDPRYVAECLRTSWLAYADDLRDRTTIESFCSNMPSRDDHELCIERVFRGLAWLQTDDLEPFAAICDTFGDGLRQRCYAAGAIEISLTAPGAATARAAHAFCERGESAGGRHCADINVSGE